MKRIAAVIALMIMNIPVSVNASGAPSGAGIITIGLDAGTKRTVVVRGSNEDVMLGIWQSNMNGATGPGQCSDSGFTTIVSAETVGMCLNGINNGDCSERPRVEKLFIEGDMFHVYNHDFRSAYRIIDRDTLALVKTKLELSRDEVARRWGSYENGVKQMTAGDGKMVLYRCAD